MVSRPTLGSREQMDNLVPRCTTHGNARVVESALADARADAAVRKNLDRAAVDYL